MAAELQRAWRDRLPIHGYLGLTDALDQFPELRDAIRPPRFDLRLFDSCFITAEGSEDLAIEVNAELIPPSDASVEDGAQGWINYELATSEAVGQIHTLDIPAGIQQAGLGSLVIAQLADLGDQLELETLELEAGKLGRWAWMRCGFDFATGEDRQRVVDTAARFAERLDREVDLSAVRHSWDFLRYDEEVSDEEIKRIGGPVISPPGQSVSLGKAMILGPNENENTWFGRLELDRESNGRVRLEGYVLGE